MKEMSFLEKLAENLVEGGFARALKPKLQPVQVAKALAREMGATQMAGPDAPLVANHYSVFLNPADYSFFAGFQTNLERELAGYLRGYAARQGLKPIGTISVTLMEATDVQAGRIRTDAVMVDTSPAPAPPAAVAEPIGSTMEMPIISPPSLPAVAGQLPAMLAGPSGEKIPIVRPVTSIGRSIENDVVLEARSVSRHHAQIRWDGEGYVLEDLDSTNGSFVSSRRVRRHILLDGDDLSFGGVVFTFLLASE